MKCSFKNIEINVLVVTIIAIITGHGSPVEEMSAMRGVGRVAFETADEGMNPYPSPDYMTANRPHMIVRKQMKFTEDERSPVAFRPKMYMKRNKVSLTHFPRGTPRRNEEVNLIREMNFREANNDILGRRVHIRQTKRKDGESSGYGSPLAGSYGRRANWLGPRRLTFMEGVRNGAADEAEGNGQQLVDQFEPCYRTGQAEDVAAPKTFMVEVEPSDDGEDEAQPKLPQCNKCYYVFEKKPFKVKFINFVSNQDKMCQQTAAKSPFVGSVPLKLSMPAFQCKPPECREVLYCKYFQCTSLGFFPDSRNCRKYFFCDLNSNGFVLYHMLCPKGRIFDPNIRECRLREMMDKRDVERCWLQAAQRRRIKKNESEEFIRYREEPGNYDDAVQGKPTSTLNRKKVRRKSLLYDYEEINGRHGQKHPGIKNTNPTHMADNKMTTMIPILASCPSLNFSIQTQMIPIPVLPTIPKYCETTQAPDTTTMEYVQTLPVTASPTTTPTTTTTTTTTTAATTTTTTTTTVATTTTTPATTPPTTTVLTTVATPEQPHAKPTPPVCPPPTHRKSTTCPQDKNSEEYYLGDIDSDAYQEDMQEDDYSEDYYDGPIDDSQDNYDWLRRGLSDYLELLKLRTEDVTSESSAAQNTLPLINGYIERDPYTTPQKNLVPDFDREKRSEEKNATATAEGTESVHEKQHLPNFEECYNEKKRRNLDGYPCMRYGRYPDKFDRTYYYECGVQLDGNMKIEHRRCAEGEEFSPEYLECIGTEYLKVAHRRRRFPEVKKPNGKQNPTPEPEYNDEDDKELPNEWLDANHRTKVPNEFKSKTKHTLRIFHLHCKRNSSESGRRSMKSHSGAPDRKEQHHNVRSFIIRGNKNDAAEQQEGLDEDYDEEYDDDEDYYDASEETKTDRSPRVTAETTTSTGISSSTQNSFISTASSKVLLDADIHVNREFEETLKSILGKRAGGEQGRKPSDSILIRLSGDNTPDRSKRNFITELFSKKPKSGEDPEKEGVVSMLTLINGLPSEYERDALLQKLERRKMMNSHLYKNRQRTMRKRNRDRKSERYANKTVFQDSNKESEN